MKRICLAALALCTLSASTWAEETKPEDKNEGPKEVMISYLSECAAFFDVTKTEGGKEFLKAAVSLSVDEVGDTANNVQKYYKTYFKNWGKEVIKQGPAFLESEDYTTQKSECDDIVFIRDKILSETE